MVERNQDLKKKFRKVAKTLSYFDLHRISRSRGDFSMGDADVSSMGSGKPATDFFLGYYSIEGLYTVLEKYGFFEILSKRGHSDFVIDLDLSDYYHQIFRLYSGGKREPENMLAELIVQEGSLKPQGAADGDEHFEVVYIHWMTLQDPLREFSPERPQIPGQNHPGLGIGRGVLELLIVMAGRLEKDGLLIFPQYFHNALLYKPTFRFFDPLVDGRVNALDRDMGGRCLAEKAWLMYLECMVDRETGEYVKWKAFEQLLPINPRFKRHFEAKKYYLARSNAEMTSGFDVDESKFERALEAEGPPLKWLIDLRRQCE